MDNSRSYMNTKQEKVKSNSPPEDFFSGKDLEMGRAIYNGDIKTIEHLIKEKGFDVNGRGETKSDGRLQRWSYIGYSILVSEIKSTEELLKLGADVNSYSFDGSGVITTIGQACSFKNKKIIELLLDYKVNLNPPLSGSPIQELLIGDVDKSLIELLLDNGANINHQNYFSGSTPIFTALRTDKFDFVNYFLDNGADPMMLDYVGNSFSFLIQKEIDEGRLSDYGIKEYNKIRERLVNEFDVKFPLKNEYKKGLENSISRYENLSKQDKELLGIKESNRIQLFKESVEKGVTPAGEPF